jgi:hypothetical protein
VNFAGLPEGFFAIMGRLYPVWRARRWIFLIYAEMFSDFAIFQSNKSLIQARVVGASL